MSTRRPSFVIRTVSKWSIPLGLVADRSRISRSSSRRSWVVDKSAIGRPIASTFAVWPKTRSGSGVPISDHAVEGSCRRSRRPTTRRWPPTRRADRFGLLPIADIPENQNNACNLANIIADEGGAYRRSAAQCRRERSGQCGWQALHVARLEDMWRQGRGRACASSRDDDEDLFKPLPSASPIVHPVSRSATSFMNVTRSCASVAMTASPMLIIVACKPLAAPVRSTASARRRTEQQGDR